MPAIGHDVEQAVQRGTGHFNAAIGKVPGGGLLVRGHDVIHPVREDGQVLFLGAQDFFGEYGIRIVEDAAKKCADKTAVMRQPSGRPIPSCRQNQSRRIFQVAIVNEK